MLISPCKLSQTLYVEKEGATNFHPAVARACQDWFSKLQLPMAEMQRYLDGASIQEWKKVKRIDSEAGDLMCAGVHCSARDSRSSSYIRVSFS